MITFTAEDFEEVYPVPSKFLMEFRNAFLLFTERCVTRRINYDSTIVHRSDIIHISVSDPHVVEYMNSQVHMDFLSISTLRSYKCKIPGTYEVYAPFDTITAQYMRTSEDEDGLYVLPISLAVRRIQT